MAIKSVSIRIEEEMLKKLGFVADYEGRSVNSHILASTPDPPKPSDFSLDSGEYQSIRARAW